MSQSNGEGFGPPLEALDTHERLPSMRALIIGFPACELLNVIALVRQSTQQPSASLPQAQAPAPRDHPTLGTTQVPDWQVPPVPQAVPVWGWQPALGLDALQA